MAILKTGKEDMIEKREKLLNIFLLVFVVIFVLIVRFATAGEIHEAARKGDLATVKRVFEQGVDINQTDKDGNMPIQIAAAKGNIEIVRFLTEYGANLITKIKPEQEINVQAKPKDNKTVAVKISIENKDNANELDVKTVQNTGTTKRQGKEKELYTSSNAREIHEAARASLPYVITHFSLLVIEIVIGILCVIETADSGSSRLDKILKYLIILVFFLLIPIWFTLKTSHRGGFFAIGYMSVISCIGFAFFGKSSEYIPNGTGATGVITCESCGKNIFQWQAYKCMNAFCLINLCRRCVKKDYLGMRCPRCSKPVEEWRRSSFR